MLKKFLTLILIVTIGSALLAQTPKPETTQYTCVMHPEVVRDHPGKCPKCGMTLVPKREKPKRSTLNAQRPTSNAGEAGAIEPNRPSHAHHHGAEAGPEMQMSMHSSINISDPMNRESSGTAWVPDST